MLFTKHAEEVNKAFKRSSMTLQTLKKDCETEIFPLNLSVLFAECVIALNGCGYSREDILKRLNVEFDIHEDKLKQGRSK